MYACACMYVFICVSVLWVNTFWYFVQKYHILKFGVNIRKSNFKHLMICYTIKNISISDSLVYFSSNFVFIPKLTRRIMFLFLCSLAVLSIIAWNKNGEQTRIFVSLQCYSGMVQMNSPCIRGNFSDITVQREVYADFIRRNSLYIP